MRIPTKARYGLRAMQDIAMNNGDNRATLLKDVAARQDLSERYLEQIFSSLRHAGLVRSVRGAKGGFLLARPASEINLLEIVEGCIGDLNMVDCVENSSACEKADKCASYIIWKDLTMVMQGYLKSKTLADIVEMQGELNSQDYTYCI